MHDDMRVRETATPQTMVPTSPESGPVAAAGTSSRRRFLEVAGLSLTNFGIITLFGARLLHGAVCASSCSGDSTCGNGDADENCGSDQGDPDDNCGSGDLNTHDQDESCGTRAPGTPDDSCNSHAESDEGCGQPSSRGVDPDQNCNTANDRDNSCGHKATAGDVSCHSQPMSSSDEGCARRPEVFDSDQNCGTSPEGIVDTDESCGGGSPNEKDDTCQSGTWDTDEGCGLGSGSNYDKDDACGSTPGCIKDRDQGCGLAMATGTDPDDDGCNSIPPGTDTGEE